jgi:hypothetical protein
VDAGLVWEVTADVVGAPPQGRTRRVGRAQVVVADPGDREGLAALAGQGLVGDMLRVLWDGRAGRWRGHVPVAAGAGLLLVAAAGLDESWQGLRIGGRLLWQAAAEVGGDFEGVAVLPWPHQRTRHPMQGAQGDDVLTAVTCLRDAAVAAGFRPVAGGVFVAGVHGRAPARLDDWTVLADAVV